MKNNVKLNIPTALSFPEMGNDAVYICLNPLGTDLTIKLADEDKIILGKLKSEQWEKPIQTAVNWLKSHLKIENALEIKIQHHFPELSKPTEIIVGLMQGILSLKGEHLEKDAMLEVLMQLNSVISIDLKLSGALLNGGWTSCFKNTHKRIYEPPGLQYILTSNSLSTIADPDPSRIIAFMQAMHHSDFDLLKDALGQDTSYNTEISTGYLGKLYTHKVPYGLHFFNNSLAVDDYSMHLRKQGIPHTICNLNAEGIITY